MRLKKSNWLLIAVGLTMRYGAWLKNEKSQLITTNIEALTVDWEAGRIDGDLYRPVELGRPATDEEKKQDKNGTLHATMIKRPPTIEEGATWYRFWDKGNKKFVPLPKCKGYDYSFGTNAYCYKKV